MTRRATISTSRLDPAIGSYDHLRGVLGAPYSLVEYGDYECPYCRAAQPVVEEVIRILGDQLVFAFRHFPLYELHPYSLAAATAAEGASLKGLFWPMHERMFSGDEPRLAQDDLRGYAEEIGVQPVEKVLWPNTRFVEDRVEADFNSGVRSGVLGTPSFFVNGVLHDGPVTVRGFLDALRREPVPADS
ncbi:DsbA family protein [Pseudonocardia sp. N23]|uniref:DsbA family protein n=1 Tax=Pseudonocardia sp. N23 TaxID=1987376 RepID=UPI000BFCAD20|nr:thioredoxin domain-containing protein [Pseudonocardia sp. N23]GAY11247.1 Na+/H+ antiporter NhaA [Pseudonocardia sp. N23]